MKKHWSDNAVNIDYQPAGVPLLTDKAGHYELTGEDANAQALLSAAEWLHSFGGSAVITLRDGKRIRLLPE